MPFKFDNFDNYPQIIPSASPTEDGVMTALQAAQLAALVAGTSFLVIYTNLTRPAANAVGAIPGVKAAVIWNSDDSAPNFSDGTNWYDADGNLT